MVLEKELYKVIKDKKASWANEEEVKSGWLLPLSNILKIDFHLERSNHDLSYNNVIVEFKDKGLFKGKTTSRAFKEAIYDRLKPYILKAAKKDNIDPSDYIGIAIDADHISFAQIIGEDINYGPLLPFSEASVSMVATAFRDSFRRAITAENLIEDFGHASPCGIQLMTVFAQLLSESINQKNNNKIKMLFEEWKELYGQIADLSNEQIQVINKNLPFSINVKNELKIPAILFIIHTYNSLIIKLLAAEIVSSHGLTSYNNFAQRTAILDDNEIIKTIQIDIEEGQIFERAGIKGFVEEVIFSWYIDCCLESKNSFELVLALREILVKLSLFRTDKLTVARSNDILKRFYQNLVPETLRKSLGEFYTPDWLVSFTVDQIEDVNWLNTRMLDPTCGSGTFLLEVMRRKIVLAKEKKWDSSRIINHLTDTVWGFDLNPLAVQSSRVNFLISIAELMQTCKGIQIELPILLADAVYSPSCDPENEEIICYNIGSQTASLNIILPVDLAFNRQRLEYVFKILGNCVEKNMSYDTAELEMIKQNSISINEADSWRSILKSTYEKVLNLHQNNWNGIWFRIVRNFFWSAAAGEFDIIVGNPPWVRWSKLPETYRERIKPTCMKYKIFSSTPHHGGNELDISGMITYTVADKWLKQEGKLAFVITQSHFQAPSSEGFRNFKINDEDNLIPIVVNDFKQLKPFPNVANKTAVVLFRKEKNSKPKYPIPYIIWDANSGKSKLIPVDLEKEQVFHHIKSSKMEAYPVSTIGSPWAILPTGRFLSLKKLTGKCSWIQGRKGITADLNGVYFVEILSKNDVNKTVQITTRPEAGKRDIGPKQSFWIESDLLFPLIKGASDFTACQLTRNHNLFAFVPNKGIIKEKYNEAELLMSQKLHLTNNYFKTYETQLRTRSTFKGRMKNAPFYAVYNVGDYTFAPWKVIWAEQKDFCTAVVDMLDVPFMGSRPYVPDHKIFFVDFYEKEPAYFLCGILNSPIVKEYVESHNISIQIGDIFKHMKLPSFSYEDNKHKELSKLVFDAHNTLNKDEYCKLLNKIGELAEQIINNNECY